MIQKIMYECGCMADGDNVAVFCPMHGDPILKTCQHINTCETCKVHGGFPICYAPWENGPTCKAYEPQTGDEGAMKVRDMERYAIICIEAGCYNTAMIQIKDLIDYKNMEE